VAAALRAHPEDSMVQGYGCEALYRLADEHPANQAAAGEAGAIGLVTAAMRAHPEDALLHPHGRDALWCMAANHRNLAENHPANAAAAREAGCVQLIAAAVRAYPEDEYVQRSARAALKILEPGHALLA
jgi:hypothetical protein